MVSGARGPLVREGRTRTRSTCTSPAVYVTGSGFRVSGTTLEDFTDEKRAVKENQENFFSFDCAVGRDGRDGFGEGGELTGDSPTSITNTFRDFFHNTSLW